MEILSASLDICVGNPHDWWISFIMDPPHQGQIRFSLLLTWTNGKSKIMETAAHTWLHNALKCDFDIFHLIAEVLFVVENTIIFLYS